MLGTDKNIALPVSFRNRLTDCCGLESWVHIYMCIYIYVYIYIYIYIFMTRIVPCIYMSTGGGSDGLWWPALFDHWYWQYLLGMKWLVSKIVFCIYPPPQHVSVHGLYFRILIEQVTADSCLSDLHTKLSPDNNVHGANMEPTWVLSAPDGLHVGPMNLAIREDNQQECSRLSNSITLWYLMPWMNPLSSVWWFSFRNRFLNDSSLQWSHNGRDGVSNHQTHDCLLNSWFGCRSKKTSKLRVTGLCAGKSPGTGDFPAQMASNAENVSIWWRHHVVRKFDIMWRNFAMVSCLYSYKLYRSTQVLHIIFVHIINVVSIRRHQAITWANQTPNQKKWKSSTKCRLFCSGLIV